MIGKNGQRIRDLMEESGAKIWIDQEKFKGQETRNVYISGDPKHVVSGMLLTVAESIATKIILTITIISSFSINSNSSLWALLGVFFLFFCYYLFVL